MRPYLLEKSLRQDIRRIVHLSRNYVYLIIISVVKRTGSKIRLKNVQYGVKFPTLKIFWKKPIHGKIVVRWLTSTSDSVNNPQHYL